MSYTPIQRFWKKVTVGMIFRLDTCWTFAVGAVCAPKRFLCEPHLLLKFQRSKNMTGFKLYEKDSEDRQKE